MSYLQLLRQQIELIGAEGVELKFEDEAIREIARMAAQLNKTVENIGARRLHTVLERIMETISFDAAEMDEGEVRCHSFSAARVYIPVMDDSDVLPWPFLTCRRYRLPRSWCRRG